MNFSLKIFNLGDNYQKENIQTEIYYIFLTLYIIPKPHLSYLLFTQCLLPTYVDPFVSYPCLWLGEMNERKRIK